MPFKWEFLAYELVIYIYISRISLLALNIKLKIITFENTSMKLKLTEIEVHPLLTFISP